MKIFIISFKLTKHSPATVLSQLLLSSSILGRVGSIRDLHTVLHLERPQLPGVLGHEVGAHLQESPPHAHRGRSFRIYRVSVEEYNLNLTLQGPGPQKHSLHGP